MFWKRKEPETGFWDLYIFPGGKVAETSTRAKALKWSERPIRGESAYGERRAINRVTNEHIVFGKTVWAGNRALDTVTQITPDVASS